MYVGCLFTPERRISIRAGTSATLAARGTLTGHDERQAPVGVHERRGHQRAENVAHRRVRVPDAEDETWNSPGTASPHRPDTSHVRSEQADNKRIRSAGTINIRPVTTTTTMIIIIIII